MKLNIHQLCNTISDADAFVSPSMNAGVDYLYNHVYKVIASGRNLSPLSLDFDKFDLEDIEVFRGLYTEIIEDLDIAINSLKQNLDKIPAICKPVSFI